MVENIYALTEAAITNAHAKKAENADKEKIDSKDDNKVNLFDYEGSYHVANYDDDSYIGVNEDGLFFMSIFSRSPVKNMQTWVHEKNDTFRRKRSDDTLAEAITFERDADGQVTAMVQHGYRSMKR